MPRTKANALTALKVRAMDVPGDYSDGNGLTLRVEKSGAKRWVQRVSIGGKQRNIGLGGYPTVSLAAARDAAIVNLQAVKAGRDVIAERKEAREITRQPKQTVPTFAEEAAETIRLLRPTWSNPKHAGQWESTLATYAFPVVGNKPADSITTADVLAVLKPIWTCKPETASRVRQRMESVFDMVIADGHRLDNPAGKHNLKVLPRVRKTKQHHRALPFAEVPAALERVRTSTADRVTRLAFEFLVLTAARSGARSGSPGGPDWTKSRTGAGSDVTPTWGMGMVYVRTASSSTISMPCTKLRISAFRSGKVPSWKSARKSAMYPLISLDVGRSARRCSNWASASSRAAVSWSWRPFRDRMRGDRTSMGNCLVSGAW